MPRIRISFRIGLMLALISATAFWAVAPLGLWPEEAVLVKQGRHTVCNTLAVEFEQLVDTRSTAIVQRTLKEFVKRNPEVRTAAVRRSDGTLLASAGEHLAVGLMPNRDRASEDQMRVPIMKDGRLWGHFEVVYPPLYAEGWGQFDWKLIRLIGFFIALNSVLFILYLRRVLTELDPQRTVPDRVRGALDSLAEGLLVLNERGRIVMANKAFSAVTGFSAEALAGRNASDLPWLNEDATSPPWECVARDGVPYSGVALALLTPNQVRRSFVVNAAPIFDAKGVRRGTLATFDDVTPLENNKRELVQMLHVLQESRERITRQNEELRFLATRDPMTGCLNRRSFFEQFETFWQAAQSRGRALACIMVDVDHFKSINDNFGHSMGDEVLKKVASALLSTADSTGLVCRFGGEEFCVLLPGCELDGAREAAERYRTAIEALPFSNLQVTASLGVSANTLGAASPQDMLDEADKSLYYSKRTGRNRVTRWDQVPADAPQAEAAPAREAENKRRSVRETAVPYQAVTSLMAALAYRDPDTAAHSQRVADAAVATAKGLISAGEAYLLEVAALLHDIGKIGVPDSILLKATDLTAEEQEIMDLHVRMGVDIVQASFPSPALVDIVRHRECLFGGDPARPEAPQGSAIPLGARIIAVCDAYDGYVMPHGGEAGVSQEEAFAQLLLDDGRRFDPDIVEQFIDRMSARLQRPAMPSGLITKELALNLGLQTERLSRAVDEQDLATIHALAGHLEATAAKHNIADIRAAAACLAELSERDEDIAVMLQLCHEIMDLSLDAQQASLLPSGEIAEAVELRKQLATTAV